MNALEKMIEKQRHTCKRKLLIKEKQHVIPCTCEVGKAAEEYAALKAWKEAVEEACIIDWVEIGEPKETLANLIKWNIVQALDPAISKDASELIEKHTAALKARVSQLEELRIMALTELQTVASIIADMGPDVPETVYVNESVIDALKAGAK